MESIHKFENMVEGWLKPLPHLPANGRKWLAENSWWLTIIGVVLSAFAILALYRSLTAVNDLNNALNAFSVSVGVQPHSSLWTTSVYVSMALLAATTVIEAIAISPLKMMSKKGWDLLFLAAIVGVASGIIGAVLNADIVSVIFSLIGAAISAYILFEIRPSFKK